MKKRRKRRLSTILLMPCCVAAKQNENADQFPPTVTLRHHQSLRHPAQKEDHTGLKKLQN
jgi:hypothetical protein